MAGSSAVVVAAVIIAAAAVLLFPRGQERGSEQYSVGSQIAPHLLGGSDRRGLPYLFYEPSPSGGRAKR